MHRANITVISTGGTIAMRFDPKKNGMVPAVNGDELIEAIPSIREVCNLEVVNFSNIHSAHVTIEHMKKLAERVEEELQKPNVDGIVITHGTDTVEETAYFLSLYLDSEKPVCLTAAMKTSDQLGTDGAVNIQSAIRVAADSKSRNLGVVVVLNSEIHAAKDARKTHANNVKAFASPFWGPVGYADSDTIIHKHRPIEKEHLKPKDFTARVPILKAYTGIDELSMKHLLTEPIDGLIIEAFGQGNLPPTTVPIIEQLIERNIPVLITSRVFGGRVLDVYAVTGAGGDLKKRGAILAGELSSQKARIKLIMVLGLTKDMEEIKAYFANE